MAEVNQTHTSQLSGRNSEPTNLKGASADQVGGPTPGGVEPNTVKLDGARSVSADTTIPKAVGSEKSHLKTQNEDDDVEIDFDGDEVELDEIDNELDSIGDVDVDVKSEDFNFDKKDDDEDKKVDESEEDDEKKDAVNEDEDADEKKDDLKEDDEDDEKKDAVNESEDEDDKDKVNEDEEDDEKKLEEDEDDEDKKEVVKESIKIRLKFPKTNLFESVNLPAKQQKKIAVVFEQAVKSSVKAVAKQLQEHYQQKHTAKIAKRDEKMKSAVDSYLTYVAEEWIKSNRPAVRSSLRAQLAEEFLNGLQSLFKEHYIDVPESKIDVVKTLTAKNASLKKSLNESLTERVRLRKVAQAANKARIVMEATRNLSEAQASKLLKLAENTKYESAKDFRGKVSLLKESYFGKNGDVKTKTLTKLPEDDVKVITEEKKVPASENPEIAEVASAISRHVKGRSW